MIHQLVENEEIRRREFPICRRKIYCAHAADAPLPRRVAESMWASIERASTSERQFELELEEIAKTREKVARLLGVTAAELAFTGPTSVGLNAVANGLEWRQGDEVVCYLDDYPANVYPWLALERHGVKVSLIKTPKTGEITPERVAEALTPKTKLVALSSANFCSGYRIDLEAIGALCSERGILLSIDAIQTLGVFPLPMGKIDFVSAGSQKWMLGPSGGGILFVKTNRRHLLRPTVLGGWNVESPNFLAQREINYPAGGRKFEPGAYPHSVIAGLGAAVELLLQIQPAEMKGRILRLVRNVRDYLAPYDFEFLSPDAEQNTSGILSFRHRSIPSEQLFRRLEENDIVVSLRSDRLGRSWLRFSPHFYNTDTEMERVVELLASGVSL